MTKKEETLTRMAVGFAESCGRFAAELDAHRQSYLTERDLPEGRERAEARRLRISHGGCAFMAAQQADRQYVAFAKEAGLDGPSGAKLLQRYCDRLWERRQAELEGTALPAATTGDEKDEWKPWLDVSFHPDVVRYVVGVRDFATKWMGFLEAARTA